MIGRTVFVGWARGVLATGILLGLASCMDAGKAESPTAALEGSQVRSPGLEVLYDLSGSGDALPSGGIELPTEVYAEPVAGGLAKTSAAAPISFDTYGAKIVLKHNGISLQGGDAEGRGMVPIWSLRPEIRFHRAPPGPVRLRWTLRYEGGGESTILPALGRVGSGSGAILTLPYRKKYFPSSSYAPAKIYAHLTFGESSPVIAMVLKSNLPFPNKHTRP